MSEKIIISVAAGFLILFLIFVGVQVKQDMVHKVVKTAKVSQEPVSSPQKSLPITLVKNKLKKTAKIKSQGFKPSSSGSELLKYLDQFDVPNKIKKVLADDFKNGITDQEWVQSPITEADIRESGISPKEVSAFKPKNITAGYKVSDAGFDSMFKAAVKTKGLSAQEKNLKAKALVDLGFSVAQNFKPQEAQKAFQAVINDYPDSESAPIAYLEYSRLLFEAGRLSEAGSVVSEAIYKYAKDKGFLSLAKSLKNEINSYE